MVGEKCVCDCQLVVQLAAILIKADRKGLALEVSIDGIL
jgi:hypothetical protein